MPPTSAWVTSITPRRSISSTGSHWSGVVLTKKPPSPSMPALLTSTSTGPSSPSAASTAAATDSALRTSVTATRAPSAASRRQVAAPMPPEPPVTSAVFPSSLTCPRNLPAYGRAHGLQAAGGAGASVRRRPLARLLLRAGRLQPRPRHVAHRRHARRPAHPARVGLLGRHGRGPPLGRARLA